MADSGKLIGAFFESEIRRIIHKVDHGIRGVGIKNERDSITFAPGPSIGRGGGSSAPVQRYQIQSIESDYLVCKTWDGATLGAAVNIAKPPSLRTTITTVATPAGTGACTYDTGAVTRTVTVVSPALSETQLLNVSYAIGDEIFAFTPVGGTGVTGATLQDMNVDARHWVRQQT